MCFGHGLLGMLNQVGSKLNHFVYAPQVRLLGMLNQVGSKRVYDGGVFVAKFARYVKSSR